MLLSRNQSPENGGAIRAKEGAYLLIEYSDFTNNQAVLGGALLNEGSARLAQSTFSDNRANAAVRSCISGSKFLRFKLTSLLIFVL